MMSNYEFRETSSRNITENGEQLRVVNFRGSDNSENRNDKLNVDGSFTMPVMEYYQAGIDGDLKEVIRDKVVDKLTPTEEDNGEASE